MDRRAFLRRTSLAIPALLVGDAALRSEQPSVNRWTVKTTGRDGRTRNCTISTEVATWPEAWETSQRQYAELFDLGFPEIHSGIISHRSMERLRLRSA